MTTFPILDSIRVPGARGPYIKPNFRVHKPDPLRLGSECAALGCVLINEKAIHEVVDVLGSNIDAFYFPHNRTIFNVFLKLWDLGKPIDVVTVIDECRKHEAPEPSEGWGEYVTELACCVPTSANAAVYANQVRDRHREVEGINAVKAVAQSPTPEPHLIPLADKILKLNQTESTKTILTTKQLSAGAVDRLESIAANGINGASTGYVKLDETLRGGFQRGDMIVIAARPSHGKTAIALNMAYRASKSGATPFVVSLEMSRESVFDRLIGIHTDARMHSIYNRFDAHSQIRKVRAGLDSFARLPIHLCDESNLDIARIAHRCVAFAQRHPNTVILIDYLQLIRSSDRFKSRETEVADISRQLKNIARQTNCPVVVCCQLNRESESQADHYKKLAYLRESGSIEQDADVVMILCRATEAETKEMEPQIRNKDLACNTLILCVAKHRNGPVGKVALHFDRWTQRISEFSEFGTASKSWGTSDESGEVPF